MHIHSLNPVYVNYLTHMYEEENVKTIEEDDENSRFLRVRFYGQINLRLPLTGLLQMQLKNAH